MVPQKYTVIGYWNYFERDVTPISTQAIVLFENGEHHLIKDGNLEVIDEFKRWESEGWVSKVSPFQIENITGMFLIYESLEGVKTGLAEPEMCATYLLPEDEKRMRKNLKDAYLQKVAQWYLCQTQAVLLSENIKMALDHALRADYSDLGLHLLLIATTQDSSSLSARVEELRFVMGQNNS